MLADPECSAAEPALPTGAKAAFHSLPRYTAGRSSLTPSLLTTTLILCSAGWMGTSYRIFSVIYTEHSLTGSADYRYEYLMFRNLTTDHNKNYIEFKFYNSGEFPAVQRLGLRASTAGSTGSTSGQGTKIPHTAWRSQKQKQNQQN